MAVPQLQYDATWNGSLHSRAFYLTVPPQDIPGGMLEQVDRLQRQLPCHRHVS